MVDIQTVWALLKGRSETEMARISAYVLAPGLLIGISISGVLSGSGLDLERPFAVSPLKTAIGVDGATSKRGLVLIAEPADSEYRIPLQSTGASLWTSLDEEQVKANKGHLVLDSTGLNGKTPFVGVNEPVTVVVEGQVGEDVRLLASTESINDWLVAPKRSNSIVSSVLFACIFAFGISIASGIPSGSSREDTAR